MDTPPSPVGVPVNLFKLGQQKRSPPPVRYNPLLAEVLFNNIFLKLRIIILFITSSSLC